MTTAMDARGWTNDELEELGLNLVKDGEAARIRIRLLGGVAVRLLCREVILEHPELDRQCGDIDLAGLSEDSVEIERLLRNRGFIPNREFNFLNESSRMLFLRGRLKADVILDEFRMNHRWPIRKRLVDGLATLPFEDILLTKMQIVDLTEKDITDLLALGLLGASSEIDFPYILRVSLGSWGFTQTVLRTCENVAASAPGRIRGSASEAISFFHSMERRIEEAPKSTAWWLRSLFGRRIRWYESAEEPQV